MTGCTSLVTGTTLKDRRVDVKNDPESLNALVSIVYGSIPGAKKVKDIEFYPYEIHFFPILTGGLFGYEKASST